jgi:drug/metabolite transporter (DMT)-like permease
MVRALGLISPSRLGTLALAEPLTSMALGILLLAERLSLHTRRSAASSCSPLSPS